MPPWITDIFSGGFSSVCGAIGSVFDYLTGRSAANNAPDMKANKEAIDDQKFEDKVTADLKKNDINAIRTDVSD